MCQLFSISILHFPSFSALLLAWNVSSSSLVQFPDGFSQWKTIGRERWIGGESVKKVPPLPLPLPQLYISGSSCFLQTAPMGKPSLPWRLQLLSGSSRQWMLTTWFSLSLSLKPRGVNCLPLFLVVKYLRSNVCAFTPSKPLYLVSLQYLIVPLFTVKMLTNTQQPDTEKECIIKERQQRLNTPAL